MRRTLRRMKPPPHAAYTLRRADPLPAFWRLSFDGSSCNRVGGDGFGEWAWVLQTPGGTRAFSDHGPARGDTGNLFVEWEGLCAGLQFLEHGLIRGMAGLLIHGDERVVIGQLHGTMICHDHRSAGWREEALDSLLHLALPWTAAKVGRESNREADGVSRGGW